MKTKTYFTQIIAFGVGLLLLGGLGAYWPTLVGANLAASTLAPGDVTADAITYQGYLTDENNIPLNGTFAMVFEIYNAQAGGTLLYDSGEVDIKVTNGLFEVRLPISDDIFNGEELWLAQTVNKELLTPRQEILPSPMAHTLRPGAVIKGTASAITNNYTVEVHMNNDAFAFNRGAITGQTTTGNAIYGLANNGRAIYGQTRDGYAVYGFDGGTLANRGYAGYFYSTNGIGVYAYSNANRTHPNILAPAVYGQSNRGVGVYGRGDTSNSYSFYNQGGYFEGGKGLFARGTDSEIEAGYGAQIFSNNYIGLYVLGDNDDYDAHFDGSVGILVDGSVTTSAANSTVLTLNMGETSLATGDLVAMVGVTESPSDGQPMLAVASVNATNQNAVIGVVKEAIAVSEISGEDGNPRLSFSPTDGEITPGGYLVIITEGLAPAVNLSSLNSDLAAASSLAIGDKIALSTSGETTQSAAGAPAGGIVIGKVAGPVDEATGTVPMYIDID